MARFASIVLVLGLGGDCALAAQSLDNDSPSASLSGDATSLQPTLGVACESQDDSEIAATSTPTPQYDDWRAAQSYAEPTAAVAAAADGLNGLFRPRDPNTTRLLIGPTGRSLKRGEAYLDSFGVSVPLVQVGVTDRISIGAGTPVFIPGERPGGIFWLTPKVQVFAGTKTTAAVGVLHASDGGAEGAGIAYGVVTRGTEDAAVTAGLGYAYRRSPESDGGTPVVMVSAEKRVTRLAKLLTENYLGPGGALITGGVRLIRERLTLDLGVGATLGANSLVVVPILRFAWTFSGPSRHRFD
jgi:hypothetical protein